MMSRCRALVALVMVGIFALPARAADTPASSEPPSPALAYAVAALSTILILFTICKPSKKSFYED
jgi:hypothetical protein